MTNSQVIGEIRHIIPDSINGVQPGKCALSKHEPFYAHIDGTHRYTRPAVLRWCPDYTSRAGPTAAHNAHTRHSDNDFLGYGVPPPQASWGRMLNDARADLVNYPHLAIFPGLAIFFAVFSFNMFGDGLRDVLDPRLRGSR